MTAAELEVRIKAVVDDAISNMNRFSGAVDKTGKKAEQFVKKSTTNFTGLSRVIRDLPFGFIAISNNLEQLLPAAGGLGLAFSAVVSALTFAQVGLRNWVRGGLESTQVANEFADALKEDADQAENLKYKIDAVASSLEEMQKLWAAQNKVRFFGNDAESSLLEATDNLAFIITAYNDLSKAVEEASQNTIKAGTAQSNVIAQFGQDSEEAKKATEDYNKVVKIQFDLQKQQESKLGELQQARAQRDLAQLQFDKHLADEATKRAKEEADAIKKRIKDYTDANEALIRMLDTSKQLFKDTPITAPYSPIQITGGIFKLSDLEAAAAMINMRDQLKKAGIKVFNAQGILSDVDLLNISELQKNFDKYSEKIGELYSVIKEQVVNAAVGIGEAIGNAITGKGNIFSSLLDVIGTSMIALGAYVITGAELISKITEALTTALGGTAAAGIAVGIGLIALGTVLKNVPKFANGGIVTSPTLLLAGENGPERITPLGYEGQAGKAMTVYVEGYISNNVIRLANKRADVAAFNTF